MTPHLRCSIRKKSSKTIRKIAQFLSDDIHANYAAILVAQLPETKRETVLTAYLEQLQKNETLTNKM